MREAMIKKAVEIIREPSYFGTIGLHDAKGRISVSAVAATKIVGLNEYWFSTNTSGRKAGLIAKDNRVGICVFTQKDNISLIGTAEVVTDQQEKNAQWQDWFIDHYKGGPTDKEYCLVKVTVENVRLYIDDNMDDFELTDR